MALPAEERRYTYADALAWEAGERAELIEGEVYLMAPSPSLAHQEISGELFAQIHAYLQGKTCKVFHAPLDVRLFEQEEDSPEDVDTVVQPDLMVVCDLSRLDDRGCRGAPDMVVEILSPSTQRHDRLVKLGLYQRAGVREYWIVNPEDQTVQVMLLDGGGVLQLHEVYDRTGMAKVSVLEDCEIDLSKVFAE